MARARGLGLLLWGFVGPFKMWIGQPVSDGGLSPTASGGIAGVVIGVPVARGFVNGGGFPWRGGFVGGVGGFPSRGESPNGGGFPLYNARQASEFDGPHPPGTTSWAIVD